MKHYLIPENILNEFVSKIVKHGEKVTATIKSEKDAKNKKYVYFRHLTEKKYICFKKFFKIKD